ncbi:hypothetical protein K9M79_08460 [Candidatus Woesearchaeota archaeon]|nr:hypothetical protein [Candidatus Woesearchaeota archaeon]
MYQRIAVKVALLICILCLLGCEDIEFICYDGKITLDPRECGSDNLTYMYQDALESKGIREIRYKGNMTMNVTPEIEVVCSNGSVVGGVEECGHSTLKELYEDVLAGKRISVNYENNITFKESIANISKLLQKLEDDEVAGMIDSYLAELACVSEISHNYEDYLKYSLDKTEDIDPILKGCIDYLKEKRELVNMRKVESIIEERQPPDFFLLSIFGAISFVAISKIIFTA